MLSLRQKTGLALATGMVFFFASLVFLETLSPSYDRSTQVISDLGVGPTALAFNLSAAALGIELILLALLFRRMFEGERFPFFLGLAGVGILGVSVFPENAGFLHPVFALIAFVSVAASSVAAGRVSVPPFSSFLLLLGVLSLTWLALFLYAYAFSLPALFGVGIGWLERLIVYPFLFSGMGFGVYLALMEK
ncbi:MAG: DUF998 domain-containing protein [Candidatus Diapherotrites archaeon]|nr:DUF998 domain-containing protein [Candidatus Diapherotrites archaeon]